MNSRALSIFAMFAIFCCGIAQAQVPRKLNYQGFLTTPSGAPVNTPQTLVARIYDVSSNGTALFTETHNPVTVSNGIFNILLGSVDTNTNPLNLSFSAQYYLGITVGTDAEMSPRRQLAASPYALRAVAAESLVPGGNIVLASPTTASAGNILKGSSRFIHGVGSGNTFVGEGSGNFTLTGSSNTVVGANALGNVTSGSSNIALGVGAGGECTAGNNNVAIGNAGVAGDSNVIRIGTSQTNTYLTGVVHGNGSGLTKVPANIANGSITSAMTGTGAAQFVRSIQFPNNSVPPGSAFAIDTQVFNSIPSSIVASAGAGGTVFTLGATGTYVLDYEMSLSSAGSVGVYTGPNAGALVLDSNSIAGSMTAATWIHGRTLVVTGGSPIVVAISPVVGAASVTSAGNAFGQYLIRLTVLKI